MAHRFRLRFTFWLDLHKPDEALLAESIGDLKRERSFTTTVRDGIRLIIDLRQGNTDVLYELFPWVLTQAAELPAPEPQGENITQRFDELKQLILQQQPLALPVGAVHKFEPKTTDNDLLEIKQASADEDDKPAWNNHISMAKLLGTFDHLPPEVLAYGLRKGMIPSKKGKLKASKNSPAVNSSGSAKPMNVPQLSAPPPEDQLDLLLVEASGVA